MRRPWTVLEGLSCGARHQVTLSVAWGVDIRQFDPRDRTIETKSANAGGPYRQPRCLDVARSAGLGRADRPSWNALMRSTPSNGTHFEVPLCGSWQQVRCLLSSIAMPARHRRIHDPLRMPTARRLAYAGLSRPFVAASRIPSLPNPLPSTAPCQMYGCTAGARSLKVRPFAIAPIAVIDHPVPSRDTLAIT